MLFLARRLRLGHERVEQERNDAADDGVEDEQREERRPRDEAADRRSDEPRHVADDPENAEALLALLLGKDIGDHRGVRRAANFGEQAHERGGREQPRETIDGSKRQRAQGARHEAEEDQLSASQPIGQPAADHRSDDARKRQQPEQYAGLGHADAEFLCDVQGEERKDDGAADLVDEVDDDHYPERLRKLVVDGREGKHSAGRSFKAGRSRRRARRCHSPSLCLPGVRRAGRQRESTRRCRDGSS